MKKLLFLLLTIILISMNGLTQAQNGEVPDTIFMLSRKKILAKIVSVTASKVSYKEIGKTIVESMERKQIEKIIYSSGKKEVFNKPLVMDVSDGDYKAVILTDNPQDVIGMVKKGEVEAKSQAGSATKKSAERSAEIQIQKKAANMKATVVLITKKEAKGGYGEIPSYIIQGVAYGYQE